MNEEKELKSVEKETYPQKGSFQDNDSTARPVWITILAVAGILAVLFALGMSVFQLASRGSDRLSEITAGLGGLFEREERIVLVVDKSTVNSEDTVNVEVEHRNKKAESVGTYTVEFECEKETTIQLNDEEVACNEELEIGEEAPIAFTAIIQTKEDRYTDLPIVVRFVGEESAVETDTLLTIVNTKAASLPTSDEEDKESDSDGGGSDTNGKQDETEKTPSYITVKRYGGRYSDPNGVADLKVTVDSTGIIRNGSFRERDELSKNDRAAVTFTVTNVGTKETGVWYFSALIPTKETFFFRSNNQENLLPGDRIEYILAFDDIHGRGEANLYIHVDPVGNIRELSETNNVSEITYTVR
jgi:hypothetical protein